VPELAKEVEGTPSNLFEYNIDNESKTVVIYRPEVLGGNVVKSEDQINREFEIAAEGGTASPSGTWEAIKGLFGPGSDAGGPVMSTGLELIHKDEEIIPADVRRGGETITERLLEWGSQVRRAEGIPTSLPMSRCTLIG
jgi:hypothetical protein